ncbi:hypothetical protein [Devosia lacusdianchii]|uniref:hypothetical protein n=1 Tax=Devosia lacusdianchii TaxID=2917991 RepID=UPI001F06D119|nr:hypothetical protein [Devosia sp. JXJ CY 41]
MSFIRQPHMFEPRRTATWNIRLGFHHGQGLSSVKIAELLGDGTGPATVRTMIQGADLPSPGARMTVVPVSFEYWQRDILQRHADERGLTVHQLLYRMIASGLVLDDLYDAVTDGRYD